MPNIQIRDYAPNINRFTNVEKPSLWEKNLFALIEELTNIRMKMLFNKRRRKTKDVYLWEKFYIFVYLINITSIPISIKKFILRYIKTILVLSCYLSAVGRGFCKNKNKNKKTLYLSIKWCSDIFILN